MKPKFGREIDEENEEWYSKNQIEPNFDDDEEEPTYECPNCNHILYISEHNCNYCGWKEEGYEEIGSMVPHVE